MKPPPPNTTGKWKKCPHCKAEVYGPKDGIGPHQCLAAKTALRWRQ